MKVPPSGTGRSRPWVQPPASGSDAGSDTGGGAPATPSSEPGGGPKQPGTIGDVPAPAAGGDEPACGADGCSV